LESQESPKIIDKLISDVNMEYFNCHGCYEYAMPAASSATLICRLICDIIIIVHVPVRILAEKSCD